MIEGTNLARLVEAYPILHEIPPRLQRALSDSSYPIRLKAGEVLFDGARPPQHFVFLIAGSVRVMYLGQEREMLLYRVQPGETCILSICHLLVGMPYSARAITEQAFVGVAIPEKFFTELSGASPIFSAYLFRAFSERLVELLALLEAVSFGRLDQRLAALLLSNEITIQATHAQLAHELGSVREVISRILKEFERRGLVQLERGQVRILNRPALERIAADLGELISFAKVA
jgi:CRP/FNR family transcriptional regulator